MKKFNPEYWYFYPIGFCFMVFGLLYDNMSLFIPCGIFFLILPIVFGYSMPQDKEKEKKSRNNGNKIE